MALAAMPVAFKLDSCRLKMDTEAFSWLARREGNPVHPATVLQCHDPTLSAKQNGLDKGAFLATFNTLSGWFSRRQRYNYWATLRNIENLVFHFQKAEHRLSLKR